MTENKLAYNSYTYKKVKIMNKNFIWAYLNVNQKLLHYFQHILSFSKFYI